ncbi:MAG: 4-alpha-glucanotransferase [Rhodothermales bacterium]|nr:4-alpha-glucanotransferase [Rhodothermales bacterium]
MSSRSSGLLLHVTSLPSPFGIGDLGPGAYRFVDFLQRAEQGLWQVLPLVPVGLGDSPYSSPSTFAANPLLISPERLRDDGLLTDDDLADAPALPADRVDFERVRPYKLALLRRAYERFESGAGDADLRAGFDAFRARHAAWLDDYALFMALKAEFDGAEWPDWPADLAGREPAALEDARRQHAAAVRMRQLWQYLFERQWRALCDYAHDRGVQIFGDLPIYVAHDSADVWAHPDLFHLDAAGEPTVVAGVPPDYFSETGQRWGNPIYRWDRMRERGYGWWVDRLRRTLDLVDLVRLDHFRGFEAYWAIPAGEPTAVHGRWVEGPGAALFRALERRLGAPLPVVAENLGTITPEVDRLMEAFALPGMAVLLFAFGDPNSQYLPHHYARRLVAYTGTHDNDTVRGWWDGLDAGGAERCFAQRYLGLEGRADGEVHWAAIRALLGSVAGTVIVPLQDVLGLGSAARMNTPGLASGNWTWRLTPDQLPDAAADRLGQLTRTFGRAAVGERRTEREPAP